MAAPAAADSPQPSADGAGVYRPRRPWASPLYRLLERHFRELSLVWDDRCGLLEHGFARIRCDACAHEYLLAFSCKARYFCPVATPGASPAGASGWMAGARAMALPVINQ